MSEQTSPALRVALAYHRAWSEKDIDRAMSFIADDIVCDAPAGRIAGVQAYRAFMAPFVAMLRGTTLIGAFGDEETAVVVYDTETALVPSGPGAEWVRVSDGRITYSRFIFDRVPFQASRPPA
ncbi:MAG TPA: nuclear transport factor 2 family protein [Micromonosporaceae bacterium]|jgi:ketosteroid isomerase-like protein